MDNVQKLLSILLYYPFPNRESTEQNKKYTVYMCNK